MGGQKQYTAITIVGKLFALPEELFATAEDNLYTADTTLCSCGVQTHNRISVSVKSE